MLKTLLKIIAVLIGIPALGYACLMLWVVLSEWDYPYKSRVARAGSDVAVIGYAIDLYAKKYGHFPHQLSDLVPDPEHSPGDACFLPRLTTSPWNTPYHMEIDHASGGDRVRLWTVPDQKTQERLHVSKFSNDTIKRTYPWPGNPDLASPEAKAGIPCNIQPKPPF
jgi:hypothetical protein